MGPIYENWNRHYSDHYHTKVRKIINNIFCFYRKDPMNVTLAVLVLAKKLTFKNTLAQCTDMKSPTSVQGNHRYQTSLNLV